MIKNAALFFSATDEKTLYKQILQYETVRNNEVCVLSGCPYSGVFQQVRSSQKKTKEPNNRVLLGALLFGCVVSFGRVVAKISSCGVNTTSRRGIKHLEVSFGSDFFYFPIKVAGATLIVARGNPRPQALNDSPVL